MGRQVVEAGYAGFRGPIRIPTEEIDEIFRLLVDQGFERLTEGFRRHPDYLREIKDPTTADEYLWWHGWVFGGPEGEVTILVPFAHADRGLAVYANRATRGRALVSILGQLKYELEVLRADRLLAEAWDTYIPQGYGTGSTGRDST